MSKTLIIAEKPSVATDLARVLGKLPEFGKFERKKDYFESDTGLISSAVGHLVELKMPEGPNGKKLPWGLKHLPVIPNRFELQPIERSEARYKLLLKLLKRKDVNVVVNACDAGREGELIFRYLLQLADLNKDLTIKRMWMQSMTDNSIIDAWQHLRTDEEMQPLAAAAMCRSEGDWLIGLNGTRALTAYNSRNGGFNVTSAGRVQTPTLVILAEREREIKEFRPRTYYEVHGEFQVAAGAYQGRWFDEQFAKDEADPHRRAERIWDKAEAERILHRCEQAGSGVVEETKKPRTKSCERLFDLTSLQRECSGKHGFSASRTLQFAQQLYDRYKLTTYPRTDSRYLPEDYVQTVRDTVGALAKSKPNSAFGEEFIRYSAWVASNNRVTPTKRIFDTSKVSDHFAIIPTGKTPPASIDDAVRKVYEVILRRFLAVFYPPAEYEDTTRITRLGGDAFLTKGSVLVKPGYLEVYGRRAGVASEKGELVAAVSGETAAVDSIELKEDATRPPARYNDSTLLSAMETAGKRVDNEELREAMSERGLGTPATRASIIESLISKKFVLRHKDNPREFVCSNKGIALVDLLEEIGITTLGSPEMTGEWEHKLKEMEHGRLKRSEFMREINDLTKKIVDQTREFTEAAINRPYPDLEATCPECGNTSFRQTDGLFECKTPDCDFRVKKHIASHELTGQEAKDLLAHHRIGPISNFKNRFGQPFAADLTLVKEKKKWKVNFVFEGDDERQSELDNLSDEQVICEAPILDGSDQRVKVYETDKAYLAPDMAKAADDRGVRISKTILQREIPRDQAEKLFVEGKTDLMPGFVSKRGRRFAAHLTLDRTTGKLGWEFAPRKGKEDKDAEGAEANGGEAESAAPPKKKAVAKKKSVPNKAPGKKKKSAK
ncbi:MAG: DNA topoisomerase III [Planctomycetales bacterium]|nr:DNA topoisomerase III [Planctomycetales bacterium]